MDFELPELDRKATKAKVESHLEKYRLFKYLIFEEREASTVSSIDDVGGGRSNVPGDQTGSIAIYNVDQREQRKHFCERTERAVRHLPPMERFLIEKRYMQNDSDYLTDFRVYCHEFQPPISAMTYDKIRWKAFYRLALNLNIAVTKQS